MKKDVSTDPVTMADNSTTEQQTEEEKSSFLSRWSRQKSAGNQPSEQASELDDNKASSLAGTKVSAGNATPDSLDAAESIATAQDFDQPAHGSSDAAVCDPTIAPAEELDEQEPLLTDADMPALDTLNSDSDYSSFFSKGVSKELRQQALRHLFGHAKFNIRDGLNDYDEDYTTFEPLGDTVTSDMRWHKARKEREEKERLEAEALAQQQEEQRLQELEKQHAEGRVDESPAEQLDENSDRESADNDQQDTLQQADEKSAEPRQDDTVSTEDKVATSVGESTQEQVAFASAKEEASGVDADTVEDKIASMHDVVEGS